MKRRIRIAVSLAAAGIVVTVVSLWFSLDGIVRSHIETAGTEMTGVQVRLIQAEIQPFSGRSELKELTAANPPGYEGGDAIRIGRIYVELQPKTAFSDHPVIEELRIEDMVVNFEKKGEKSNLQVIGDSMNAYAERHPSDKQMTIRHFVLERARIHVRGDDVSPALQEIVLDPVELEGLSGPEDEVWQAISAAIMAEIFSEVAESMSIVEKTKEATRATVTAVKDGIVGLVLDLRDLLLIGGQDPEEEERDKPPETERTEEP